MVFIISSLLLPCVTSFPQTETFVAKRTTSRGKPKLTRKVQPKVKPTQVDESHSVESADQGSPINEKAVADVAESADQLAHEVTTSPEATAREQDVSAVRRNAAKRSNNFARGNRQRTGAAQRSWQCCASGSGSRRATQEFQGCIWVSACVRHGRPSGTATCPLARQVAGSQRCQHGSVPEVEVSRDGSLRAGHGSLQVRYRAETRYLN